MRLAWLAATTVVAIGCGDNASLPDAHIHVDAAPDIDAPHVDAPIPADANPLEPATLAGTGLCLDDACTMISPDVQEYAPQFVLYADGATKRRWIRIPAGMQIDTTDMDHWDFPVGTQIWKEFTTDDTPPVRIETRYIVKVADDTAAQPWFYVSYEWNAAQDATTAQPMGVTGAMGTTHNIPSRSQCKECHERLKPTRVLGFNAISLDFHQTTAGLLDLDGAITAGMLTMNPPGAASPHYPLPGSATEQAALGYLHANCAHCHNATSDININVQSKIELRLATTELTAVTDTQAYKTLVGVNVNALTPTGADCAVDPNPCPPIPACAGSGSGSGSAATGSCLVNPGDATDSVLFFRFNATNVAQHMPQPKGLLTTVDSAGATTLQTWINGL